MFESEYLMWVAALGVLAGALVSIELGRRLGQWHSGREQEAARAGLGAIDGAIFALLGLLLAFTFSGAAARFDTRRQLIIEETNAIGTAYLRLDLLPPAARTNLQDLFRKYVDARLDVYRDVSDSAATQSRLAHVGVAAAGDLATSVGSLPERDSPIRANAADTRPQPDVRHRHGTNTGRQNAPAHSDLRHAGTPDHHKLLARRFWHGAKQARRSWLHIGSLALMLAITFYVIVDLEHPRLGLIQVDPFDQALTDLRRSMN